MNETSLHFNPYKRRRLLARIFSHTAPGAIALALSALFGVWTLLVRPAAPHAVEPTATRVAVTTPATTAGNPYGALFDPGFVSGSAPVSLRGSFPLEASLEPIQPAPSVATAEPENVATAEPENVVPMPIPAPPPRLSDSTPLPVPRPAELGPVENHSPSSASGRRLAEQNREPAVPAASADNRSFFEKLFGVAQPSGHVLAYAAPEDGITSGARGIISNPPPRYDRWTAVYDVAAHTVYMPNGKRLEAHSGLGNRLDDPRYVNEKMRGATPPNVYDLQPREQLFHGVQALRLIPVGNGELYGRTGLLAHTYMLGPRGDSNGCVSFRDYHEFLRAYQNGEIKRLVVVARL